MTIMSYNNHVHNRVWHVVIDTRKNGSVTIYRKAIQFIHMNVLSVPIYNEIAMQKDIFRFAATLFSEDSNIYSEIDSQLQMIKCIFAANENNLFSINEIQNELLRIYKYHISEDEVYAAVKRNKKTFEITKVDNVESYKLVDKVYKETLHLQEKNIDSFIDAFIEHQNIKEPETCKDAIHKYLYELTTTNINSYKLLLFGKGNTKFTDSELSVNVSSLDEKELHYVHDFVEWDNGDKNIAISNIVFSCLEYCMLVNGDKPNKLLGSKLRKREIYLDTNIIFRAIGINGLSRKNVITAFLKKCKQAKLKLIISFHTKKEFFDTVDYYISQILQYPRGSIYIGAYESLVDYNLFSFYEEWCIGHEALSMNYFKKYIQSLYEVFVKEYGVIDEERIPQSIFDSNEFKDKRNYYSSSIKNKKRELRPVYVAEDDHYSYSDSHDATVVRYIEILRDKSVETKDIFFVSSDKLLRYWDMDRKEREYPIVIYPSQLFLILIKTCGRSENDFESFVNFINITTSHQQITAEKANIILSGISSITEDIKTQKLLVSAVYDGEFQDVLRNSNADKELYHKIQEFSQKYLEKELNDKEDEIANLKQTYVEKEQQFKILKEEQGIKTVQLDEKQKEIDKKSEELEKQKRQICDFAEKRILPIYISQYYIIPIAVIFFTMIIIIFMLLQVFFKQASWNFAILFFDWMSTTWFGQKVGDFVYTIDATLLAINGFFLKKYMKNPFDVAKRNEYKNMLIQKYVQKNRLG